jgi:hypothetical protein
MSARSAKLLALTRVDALADRHSGALAGANIAARVTREEWARGAIELVERVRAKPATLRTIGPSAA